VAEAHSLDDLEVGDLISELLRQGSETSESKSGCGVSRYVQIGCVKSRRKNLLKMKTWNKWKVCKKILLILCSAMLVEGSVYIH